MEEGSKCEECTKEILLFPAACECNCVPARIAVHNLLLCARTHSFGSGRSDFLMGKRREWERAHTEPANHSRSGACWENRVYKYNVTTATLGCAADRREACWEERWRRSERELLDTTPVRPSLAICLTSVNTKPLQIHNIIT